MGWAYGEVDGREAGYSVEATCEHPGCKEQIDRGLAYACGDMHGEDEVSCGGYFCDNHLFFSVKGFPPLCEACCKLVDDDPAL